MEEKQIGEESGEEKAAPKSSGSMVWVAIVIIIVIAGAVYFARKGNEESTNVSKSQPATKEPPASDSQDAKVFDVSGKPFEFSVKEIRVKKGDKVRINFTSTQGMHDWVVDEFSAKTKVLQAGQNDSVEFTADKAGTFEYYCSVPTHRQQGMVGKLIVE
jgi:nitrite reductase (NO-forming)